MKTNVTTTSREAYHTLTGKTAQIEAVARYILSRTKAGQRTWDRMVYRETGIFPNIVSARRNDIEFSGVELDGVKYVLEYSGKSKCPFTGKKVNTYGLRIAKAAPQLELFQ